MSAHSLPKTPGLRQKVEDFAADVELQVNFGDVHATVAGSTLFEKMMFR